MPNELKSTAVRRIPSACIRLGIILTHAMLVVACTDPTSPLTTAGLPNSQTEAAWNSGDDDCLVYPFGPAEWDSPDGTLLGYNGALKLRRLTTGTTAIVLLHGLQLGLDPSRCRGFAYGPTSESLFENILPLLVQTFGGSHRIMSYTYPTFFPFPSAGARLASLLNEEIVTGRVSNVLFVGHSMGGLVARSAAHELTATYQKPNVVRRIITLGTPHNGIPPIDDAKKLVKKGLSTDAGMESVRAGLAQQQQEPPLVAFYGNIYPVCVGDAAYVLLCPLFQEPNDGLVLTSSAAPAFARWTQLWPGYDHSELRAGTTGNAGDPLFQSIVDVLRPVHAVLIDPTNATLVVGSAQQITVTTEDANGNDNVPNRDVAWVSSDDNVASVAADGLVTAVGVGSATIEASSEGKTAVASITVIDATPIPVSPNFGCGCNTIGLAVAGTDLYALLGVAGTSNVQAHLFKFALSDGHPTQVLGPFTPGTGARPTELKSDGSYVYWRSGMVGGSPYVISRVPAAGGPQEPVVETTQPGGPYVLHGVDVYFQSRHADGSWWIDRVPKVGGTVTPVTLVAPPGIQVASEFSFTVSNDEVFFQECSSGTLFARHVNNGALRVVATGLNTSNFCSGEMLVVAGDVVLSQHLAGGSLLQIVSVLGGSLMTKASGLNGLSELVTDGIHLFGNELSSGEIIRFRLSDFSRVSAATMSCGGLAIDASNIYWTAARTIAPPCSDGMSGQIVRLIRTF